MADKWKIDTLTESIAAQTIEVTDARGHRVAVKIQDILSSGPTKITPAVVEQDCPVLQPRYDDFVQPIGPFFTRDSYGADAAKKSVQYTLFYKFLFAPIQQNASDFLEQYGRSVKALAEIALHFMTHSNLSGSTEFKTRLVNFLPQTDSTDTKFHGGQIAFDVMQFLET